MNKPLTVRFNWKGDLKRIGGSLLRSRYQGRHSSRNAPPHLTSDDPNNGCEGEQIGGSFIGTSPEFEMALCTVCFLAWEGDGRIDRIELDDYDVIVKAHRFGANLLSTCYPINK